MQTLEGSGPPVLEATDAAQFAGLFDAVVHAIGEVLVGKPDAVRLALICLISEGHLLLEDYPGTGKTSLARALAEACGAIPVITTATDANGVFAVDEWAKNKTALCGKPRALNSSAGHCWPAKRCGMLPPGPLRAPRPPVWRKPKNRLALILP